MGRKSDHEPVNGVDRERIGCGASGDPAKRPNPTCRRERR
jgi:hypothetical protein